MNMVGALLISALITFPALSSMRVFKSFKKVIICSSVIAVSCALVGMIVSILAQTPIGPTIVLANMAVFGAFTLAGYIKKTA